MKQGLNAYDAKAKHNWRGWQWNRIVERLTVPVNEATVLYLCGPDDVDRQKALARGFCAENLIAVDLSQQNVRCVRNGGGLAICDDLHVLLRAWPSDWPIDVVVADYCAGLNRDTAQLAIELIYAGAVSAGRGTVVAVNFQRGRDSWSNDLRSITSSGSNERLRQAGVTDTAKHRAWQWYTLYGWEMVKCLVRTQGTPQGVAGRLVKAGLRGAQSTFNSYRSNRVTMDSLVFVPLAVKVAGRYPGAEVATARRKIAALRAVRTAKMQSA